MFRLATPIASAQPISDFDDISTIITHSSLTSSKKAAPWQQSLQDNGHVFYVELTKPDHPHSQGATTTTTTTTSSTTTPADSNSIISIKTDARSVCSLCSTRSCHSYASGDTGYSSDADAQSTQSRSRGWTRPPPLDLSSHDDSLSLQSHAADFFDDDNDDDLLDDFVDEGVSVDLLLDADWTRNASRRQWDVEKELAGFASQTTKLGRERDGVGRGDLGERTRGCRVKCTSQESQPSSKCRGVSGGLCKRHYSYKACGSELCCPKVDLASGFPLTCKCKGGGLGGGSGGRRRGGGDRQVGGKTGPGEKAPMPEHPQGKKYTEVVLRLGLTQSSWDGESTLRWLETYLGIVPGRVPVSGPVAGSCHHAQGTPRNCDASEQVVIRGLTPGGPAAKSKELMIGEQLVSINGRHITWNNREAVLSSLRHSRKVRLTVTQPHTSASQQPQSSSSSSSSSVTTTSIPTPTLTTPSTTSTTTSDHLLRDPLSVLNLLTINHHHHHSNDNSNDNNDNVDNLVNAQSAARIGPRTPLDCDGGVGVVYMSMPEGGEGKEKEDEDVVYEFCGVRGVGVGEPSSVSPGKVLSVGRRLRGCFFTLHHLLAEGGGSDSRVRLLRLGVGSTEMNAACWKEGQDLLLVTAPQHRLPASQLPTTTKSVVRLVRLLYGSLHQAFGSAENHVALDQFFACMFSGVQPGPLRGSYSSLPTSLPGYMDYLPLPDDVVVSIGNTLTEYEAADYMHLAGDDSEGRRPFTVLGSMALYKGHVTCCHLAAEDARDVWTFLQYSALQQLTAATPATAAAAGSTAKRARRQQQRQLQQIVVWREVHPTRLCHDVATINSVFGYSEPHARWFLLVVGLRDTLLACILEAGGYSTLFEGSCGPNPLFVDQARAALVHLQSPDIVSACEIRLRGEGLPQTVTADQAVLPTAAPGYLPPPPPPQGSPSLPAPPGRVGEGRGVLSGERGGGWRSEEGFVKTFDKTSTLLRHTLHSAVVPTSGDHVVSSHGNTCKLGSGKGNSVFLFCQVNQQEGVIVSSPATDDGQPGAGYSLPLHRHVTENFHRSVAQIHAHFARSSVPKAHWSGGVLGGFEEDQSVTGCREEGVMFTCPLTERPDAGKKTPREMVYWVVGRRFRNQHSREVYVCFHEGTPQNAVEMAFRLSLGCPSSA